MNKLTATVVGFALVAAVSVAPAFAQGNFTTNGPFVFSFSPTNSFTVTDVPVFYTARNGSITTTGFLSLFGGTGIGEGPLFKSTTLDFSSTLGGPVTITDTLPIAFVNSNGDGTFGITSPGFTAKGDNINLQGGSPVPEASTVLSFGALLALGGVAVLRRKSAAKAA